MSDSIKEARINDLLLKIESLFNYLHDSVNKIFDSIDDKEHDVIAPSLLKKATAMCENIVDPMFISMDRKSVERSFMMSIKLALKSIAISAISKRVNVVQGELDGIKHEFDDVTTIGEINLFESYIDETIVGIEEEIEKLNSTYINKDSASTPFEHAYHDEGGELGHYAFPLERMSIGYQIEDDTDVEDNLLMRLVDHFKTATPLTAGAVALIKLFLRDGKYVDIFRPPNASVIYRGMQLDDAHAKLFLMGTGMRPAQALSKMQQLIDDQVMISDRGEQYDVDMMYNHREGTQSSSWTTDIAQARYFASTRKFEKFKWGIILHARVDEHKDVLIAGEDGLYDLEFAATYGKEAEVIALEDIHVHKIEFGLLGDISDIDRDE